MCQPTSSLLTEHVQNRPPAFHVRYEYARDEHGDRLVHTTPRGCKCSFKHFFIYLRVTQSSLWLLLLLSPVALKTSTASLDDCTSKGSSGLEGDLFIPGVWHEKLFSLPFHCCQVWLPAYFAPSHMGLKLSSCFKELYYFYVICHFHPAGIQPVFLSWQRKMQRLKVQFRGLSLVPPWALYLDTHGLICCTCSCAAFQHTAVGKSTLVCFLNQRESQIFTVFQGNCTTPQWAYSLWLGTK